MEMEKKLLQRREIVEFFLKKNLLLSSDVVDLFAKEDLEATYKRIMDNIKSQEILVLNKDLNDAIGKLAQIDINWLDLEKARALLEKGKNAKAYQRFMSFIYSQQAERKEEKSPVKVLFSYEEDSKKRDVQDFVQYFNVRYNYLANILRNRSELSNPTSISRVINKEDKESLCIIGMVKDKQTTKNKNLILELEDPTGSIKVLVNKNRPDLFKKAETIVLDEVIGVVGVNGRNIVFANNIVWPDIQEKELKKSEDEVYAVFLSDLHVGSKNFLPEAFNKFLNWINQELGNDSQREIAKKVGYVFIVGDLVDGCGIYPEQDRELEIKDIYQQYEACARLLSQIPRKIPIIICPGNHDAMRIAEPQPRLYRDLAKPIYDLQNVVSVSNPSLVNIHSSENFNGFDVLLYHGYSFDYFVANVDSIRNKGGYNRADLIMRFLLKRRHLAPTHTSTLYIPDTKQDPLLIKKVPDFFVTGHIHKSVATNYKNITLISGSCWQSKTLFQEKVGHDPEPGRVPVVNLKTREIKILKFI